MNILTFPWRNPARLARASGRSCGSLGAVGVVFVPLGGLAGRSVRFGYGLRGWFALKIRRRAPRFRGRRRVVDRRLPPHGGTSTSFWTRCETAQGWILRRRLWRESPLPLQSLDSPERRASGPSIWQTADIFLLIFFLCLQVLWNFTRHAAMPLRSLGALA